MEYQCSFFINPADKVLSSLTKLGDPLEKIKDIDWSKFKGIINKALSKSSKSNAGRPAINSLIMFKLLVIQRCYNLSDDQLEFQATDRMTFRRFLGLNLEDKIPDAKTIWLFRERMIESNCIEKLFDKFKKELDNLGLINKQGTLIDSTFIEAPKQHNTPEENEQIKSGSKPDNWSENKSQQKDIDARWTTKGNERHYGYKNHVNVDKDSKLITKYVVTDASVHDSQKISELVDKNDQVVYADSAYASDKIAEDLKAKKIQNKIHKRAYRGKPLTQKQKEDNIKKSKIRARVEHVFGFMTNSLHGLNLRTIGFKRAKYFCEISNLVYNFFRYSCLITTGGVYQN